jgi:hypothetical protein
VRDDAHVARVAHGAAPARQVVQRSLVWVWWGCLKLVSLLFVNSRDPLPLSPMLSTSSTIPSLPPTPCPAAGQREELAPAPPPRARRGHGSG